MKTRYRVLVEEKYSKWVEVIADSRSGLEDEVRTMEECGEIEWDYALDFDEWRIIDAEELEVNSIEKKEVEKWAMDMVRITAIVDPDWVLEEMTEYECMDWFEQLRDRGIDVPELATSCDLWDAVEKERQK